MAPSRLYYNRLTYRLQIAVVAIMATIASCNTAFAALGEIGFQVKICEKEMVLEHPGEMDYKMFAAWDAPYQRVSNRNMPFIEVMNLDDSTGNLTEYSMTIGDTDYNFSNEAFGDYIVLSDSTPDVAISSVVSTGDLLTITFGNGGLAPGQLVRFGIDIDPDAGIADLYPHPDFRLVLFDMNDMDGNGVSDNSVVSAEFQDPLDPTMTGIASTQLEDYEVTGPQSSYFNQFIRPYGVMEGVDVFAATATNVIPEPSSVVMTVLAVMGIGWGYKASNNANRGS